MHRIELPLKISYPTVNAYFVREPIPTLIDCGLNSAASLKALRKGLKPFNLQPEDIGKVIITHPHVDHIGLAGILAGYGAEVWLTDLAAAWMDTPAPARWDALALLLAIMAEHGFPETAVRGTDQFYSRLEPMFSAIPTENRRVFHAGDRIKIGGQSYEVIAAPGHSNRQVCFYQPDQKILFSADMLLPKTPVPLVEPCLDDAKRRDPGLPALLKSYDRFRALEVHQVFPGHGKPFTNHRSLIDSQLERIDTRKRECLALVRDGCGSLPELLGTLYRHLSPSNRLGGLAMLIGYLDLLLAEGLVKTVVIDGNREYRAA